MSSNFLYALDSGNYKQAEALASRQLRKSPQSVLAQLQSLYFRILVNKEYEPCFQKALDLISEPLNYNQLGNRDVINLALKVFESSGHTSESYRIFELLLKKQPANTELVNFWSLQALRNLDVVSVQKASFHLQRLAKPSEKRHAALNAAFNYYLYLVRGSPSLAEKKLLPRLGLGILGKLDTSSSSSEIFIASKLMQASGDLAKCAQLLETTLLSTKKFNEIDLTITRLYVEVLEQLGSWDTLYDYCSKVVTSFDDYYFWTKFLKAAKETGKLSTISDLVPIKDTPAVSRNRLLVEIDIDVLLGKSVEQNLVSYCEKFASKPCCERDVLRYLEDGPEALVETVLQKLDDIASNKLRGYDQFVAQVNIQKLANHFKKIDMAKNAQLIKEMHVFVNKQQFVNDAFVGSALLLLDFEHTHDPARFLALCEHFLKFTPKDFYLKLWLIQLYNYYNNSGKMIEIFESLSIKNVQIDTLAHLISNRASVMFKSNDAQVLKFLKQKFEFYNKESYNYWLCFLEECYNNESYTKVEKYYEFMQQIKNSLNKHQMSHEIAVFDEKHEEFAKNFIEKNNLTDNRDFIGDLGICGPRTNKQYYVVNCLQEILIHRGIKEPYSGSSWYLTKLEHEIKQFAESNEFTEIEKLQTEFLHKLWQNVATEAADPESTEHLSVLMDKIISYEANSDNFWEVCHLQHTRAKFCQDVNRTIKTNKKWSQQYFTNNKVKYNAIMKKVELLQKKLRKQSMNLKKKTNEELRDARTRVSNELKS